MTAKAAGDWFRGMTIDRWVTVVSVILLLGWYASNNLFAVDYASATRHQEQAEQIGEIQQILVHLEDTKVSRTEMYEYISQLTEEVTQIRIMMAAQVGITSSDP